MTVQAQTPYIAYDANGATTVFPYPFRVLVASDLKVFVDGVLKTLTTDYTVSGIGVGNGGNVTFVSAPAADALVLLRRTVTLERLTDYQALGDFRASTVNTDFDRVWQAIQEQEVDRGRSIKLPLLDGASTELTETAAERAGKVLGFDIDGKPVVAVPVSDSAQGLRTDLLSSVAGKGTDLQAFPDPLAPAFLKTTSDIINGLPVSVLRFGMKGDGSQNNGTRFTNMVTSILALGSLGNFTERVGVELTIPGGDFRFENTGLIPYVDNGSSGRNITIRGSGFGTVLTKVTGTGNGALIHLRGDPAFALNTNRIGNINLEQFTVDGFNEAITYGILVQKGTRLNFKKVRAIRCHSGLYAVASSECEIQGFDALGCLYNLRLDGARTVDLWGTPTSVSTDRGFVENFKIKNANLYLPAANGICADLNHCQNVFLEDPYIATNGGTTQHVRIRSEGTSGADAPTNNLQITRAFFEFDANTTTNCAVDVRALDSANVRSVKVTESQWTTLSRIDQQMVHLGVNGTQAANIVDSEVTGNTIYYTAGNIYPGLLREGQRSYGTVYERNSPLGALVGSTFGFRTQFGDFNRPLTDINVRPAAVAEGAAFPGIGGTGWSGSVGTTAIARSSNGNSFRGIPTLQLGDGSTTGALTLDYTLDVSQFREQCILISFLVQSNSTGRFIGLFPNGTAPDLASGGGDFYFARNDQKTSLTAGEANGTLWTRVAFMVPINSVAPGGSGSFGTAAACTLLIRFQRTSTSATDFVRFSDIQVAQSNRFYNRSLYT